MMLKYYPVASAFLVAVIFALTALGMIPQKPGVVAAFAILGCTNLALAATVWQKGKKTEALFLGSASVMVIGMIIVYAMVG